MAVNGPHALQTLSESGYPIKKCISIEALRYLYLADSIKAPKRLKINKKKILLLLGDIQRSTTEQMLDQLKYAYNSTKTNIEIWFKCHPANPIDFNKSKNFPLFIKNNQLNELFNKVDVVMDSVLPHQINAFCYGLPLINYLDPMDFNFTSEQTKYIFCKFLFRNC